MTTATTPAGTTTPERLGFWHRRVLPRLLDRVMNTEETREIRERVCADLSGEILEIGFGSGLNLSHLPDSVTRVHAVEPLAKSWQIASPRMAVSDAAVGLIGDDARAIPLPDHSVDAALCTWNLCSIENAERAVAEMRRVLRPGGMLHFVEHGCSPEPGVARRQHRYDRIWSRFACGCHLDRDIAAIVENGGLRLDRLDTYYTRSEPKFLGWTFEGVASAT